MSNSQTYTYTYVSLPDEFDSKDKIRVPDPALHSAFLMTLTVDDLLDQGSYRYGKAARRSSTTNKQDRMSTRTTSRQVKDYFSQLIQFYKDKDLKFSTVIDDVTDDLFNDDFNNLDPKQKIASLNEIQRRYFTDDFAGEILND